MNPAHELHSLLSDWSLVQGGQSIEQVRAETQSIADSHTRACGLIAEIRASLDSLSARGEDVGSFELFYASWWEAVVLPNSVWNNSSSGTYRYTSEETLATLKIYAAFLDKTFLRPKQVATGALGRSREAVDEILRLMSEEEGLNDDQRGYLFMLADEIRSLLDQSTSGVPVDLLRRLHELRGWVDYYIDHLRTAEKPNTTLIEKLRSAAQYVIPVARVGALAAGFALGAGADALAITDGLTPDE